MRHQVSHADRLLESVVGNLQVGRQVLIHRRIEIDLAGFDGSHHGDPREGLRDRADSKQRGVGVDAAAAGSNDAKP